jgi:hypothetical protein
MTNCGRIDDHEPHDWSRPTSFAEREYGLPKRLHFHCDGPPVTEGGWVPSTPSARS